MDTNFFAVSWCRCLL